jgi:hypothetical protein
MGYLAGVPSSGDGLRFCILNSGLRDAATAIGKEVWHEAFCWTRRCQRDLHSATAGSASAASRTAYPWLTKQSYSCQDSRPCTRRGIPETQSFTTGRSARAFSSFPSRSPPNSLCYACGIFWIKGPLNYMLVESATCQMARQQLAHKPIDEFSSPAILEPLSRHARGRSIDAEATKDWTLPRFCGTLLVRASRPRTFSRPSL